MRFAYPEIRLLLLLIPILVLLYVWSRARRRRLQSALGPRTLLDRMSSRSPGGWVALRRILVLLGVGLLVLAAARPQENLDWVNVEQAGIDLVVVLDVSLSMTAEDVRPSRFVRARQDVKDLLSKLDGDRVALVLFAGEAQLAAPLTVDYGAIRLLLDVAEPGMLSRPGTALAEALEYAHQCFEGDDTSEARAILLITDGENHEGDVDAMVKKLEDDRVRVFALGIGRPEGEPIPERRDDGTVTYKTDREGKVVMTRLDEAVLQRIAVATGGAYVPVASGAEGLDHTARLIGEMEEKAFEAGLWQLYEDRYAIFLAPALLCLALELLLRDLARRRVA
jgi:Ca-activated chloride channel family protein